jgi:hypothetical protein
MKFVTFPEPDLYKYMSPYVHNHVWRYSYWEIEDKLYNVKEFIERQICDDTDSPEIS